MLQWPQASLSCYRFPSADLWPRPNTTSIYGIYDEETGRIYIGSAICTAKRWNRHRHSLFVQQSENNFLQRAFNIRPNSFKFVIIEELKTKIKSEIIECEQKWLYFYRSYIPEFGYNLRKIADSCVGVKHTDQSRRNMAEAQRSRVKNPPTAAQIAQRANLRNFRIGMKWSDETREKTLRKLNGRICSRESVEKMLETRKSLKINWQPVIQLSLDGVEIQRFDSIIIAAKALNIKAKNPGSLISSVCVGRRSRFNRVCICQPSAP